MQKCSRRRWAVAFCERTHPTATRNFPACPSRFPCLRLWPMTMQQICSRTSAASEMMASTGIPPTALPLFRLVENRKWDIWGSGCTIEDANDWYQRAFIIDNHCQIFRYINVVWRRMSERRNGFNLLLVAFITVYPFSVPRRRCNNIPWLHFGTRVQREETGLRLPSQCA